MQRALTLIRADCMSCRVSEWKLSQKPIMQQNRGSMLVCPAISRSVRDWATIEHPPGHHLFKPHRGDRKAGASAPVTIVASKRG